MGYFFISHSSKDTSHWARPIADLLKSTGHEVFFDELSINWGESISGSLAKAFSTLEQRNDSYFLVFLSKSADASPWVQRECQVAEYMQIFKSYQFILPILLPDAPENTSRFLPFPDRVFIKAITVTDLINHIEKHVCKSTKTKESLAESFRPFMSIPERKEMTKELLASLIELGERCPSEIKHWLNELGDRSIDAIDAVSSPDHAVVKHLAKDLSAISQSKEDCLSVFISGFPGLGKTTLSKQLCYQLGPEKCSLVHIESYLKDRSDREGKSLQGDDENNYNLNRLDRDLTDLISHGRSIKVPTKVNGDYSGYDMHIPTRPVIIVDGALDFIYRIHTSPDIVIFLDAAPLTRLCLSLLRDLGRLPGDRKYSLSHALKKWHHYNTEYYSSTAYIKNRVDFLLQTDLHHRYLVLRRSSRRVEKVAS